MTADYFDQWYADIARSVERQRLFTAGLGVPPEVGPSNLVPLSGLRDLASALAVARGGRLVDLACGRGGPGLWLARELGAELVGVDFSPEAVRQATERRELFGLEASARFVVGELESTGLPAGEADGVVCVDAFQFAGDGVGLALEIRRLLRAGGAVALTSWEAIDPADELVSERIRRVDLKGSLEATGFADVVVTERTDWDLIEHAMWQRAAEMDPGDDPALVSTRDEATRALVVHDRRRRVMATATKAVHGDEPIVTTMGDQPRGAEGSSSAFVS